MPANHATTKEEKRTSTENSLMRAVADELLANMDHAPTAMSMQSQAYRYWSKKQHQEYQVLITVTRDPAEFMEPMSVLENHRG